jgi:hypothetical protein
MKAVAQPEFCCNKGKWVARCLEARADERDSRAFTSLHGSLAFRIEGKLNVASPIMPDVL